ncbi:MAG: methyltransferase domain-containing protein [Acidobacteriota bacterium]|jgi:ubiquinone/menaquinone biosynthesis C-methylase UbiE
MSLSRFDEIAGLFDRVTDAPIHRRMRRATLFPLGEVAGRTVLDLGAGPGGLAADLADRGAWTVAVDGAPEMLRRARTRLPPAVHLVRADAHCLPFRDASLDHAVGMLVLHLLADPVPALRELRRVVHPGGRLAFLTQSDGYDVGAIGRLREPLDSTEREFLEGCARSAASHPLRDRGAWTAVFRAAGLTPPTISTVLPDVVWLLFAPNEPA